MTCSVWITKKDGVEKGLLCGEIVQHCRNLYEKGSYLSFKSTMFMTSGPPQPPAYSCCPNGVHKTSGARGRFTHHANSLLGDNRCNSWTAETETLHRVLAPSPCFPSSDVRLSCLKSLQPDRGDKHVRLRVPRNAETPMLRREQQRTTSCAAVQPFIQPNNRM